MRLAWAVIGECGRQVRTVEGRVIGFDFAAVQAHACARGADARLVAEILPMIENIFITKLAERPDP